MSSRSRTTIRIEAAYRAFLLKIMHKHLPILLITEYPKSGASWLAQLISEAADLDFPRQKFPSLQPSIFHGHYLFTKRLSGKTIVFWRDPRDVMVSWYYHCLFKSDKNNHDLVDNINKRLNFADVGDIKTNLAAFIEYSFESSLSPSFSFNDFYDTWYNRGDVVHSSYEQLKAAPLEELSRVLQELGFNTLKADDAEKIIEKYSFKTQSSRNPGAEDKGHYLRKGIVGDWKNNFTQESAETLNQYLESRLISLGYEKDTNWIHSF